VASGNWRDPIIDPERAPADFLNIYSRLPNLIQRFTRIKASGGALGAGNYVPLDAACPLPNLFFF